jgi:LysR family transcriptional activator of glutamate synthase operon
MLNVDYLCEFIVIAKLGSFSLAAEELFLSQSSLSKHIIALEKELGVQLFNRTSRLSEAGREILPYAKQMCEIKTRIANIVAEQNDRNKRVLKIASIPVMAIYDITGVISGFHKEHPEINLTVSEHEYLETLKLLESGQCDLTFIRKRQEESNILEYIPFYKDYLVAVIPCSHPLSTEKELHLLQLKNEDLLFMDRKTGFYKLLFALCSNSGFIPKVKYTGRGSTLVDLVSQGMGIALLDKRHADYYKNPHVSSIRVTPAVESEICLAKFKSRNLSYAAQMFWNYIESRK